MLCSISAQKRDFVGGFIDGRRCVIVENLVVSIRGEQSSSRCGLDVLVLHYIPLRVVLIPLILTTGE